MLNTLLVIENQKKYATNSAFKEFIIQLGKSDKESKHGIFTITLTYSEMQGTQVTCPK